MIYTSCSNELHPLWVALFHYLLDGFHYLLDAFHYLENPTLILHPSSPGTFGLPVGP